MSRAIIKTPIPMSMAGWKFISRVGVGGGGGVSFMGAFLSYSAKMSSTLRPTSWAYFLMNNRT